MISRLGRAAVAAALLVSACSSRAPSGPNATWTKGADLPTPRTEVAVAALDGKIYVAGGFTKDGKASDVVDEYDAARDTWEIGEKLPVPIHHSALAVASGRLWIIGGYLEDDTGSARVWSWRSGEPTWRDEPSLPSGRGALAVAVSPAPERIHVFGGADRFGGGASLIGEHAVFDVADRLWTTQADLPTPRDHLAAATVGGAVAVVGGRRLSAGRNLGSLELFDPKRRSWAQADGLPTARGGLAAAALGRRLFVFGGEQPSGTFETTEIYDTKTESWSAGPPMPTARHGLGAAVVGERIYVIGGGPEPGLSVSSANEILSLEM